ncbi:MAG: SPASM domain-containing protein [Calditrichaeota bacterium]|nr:SPASM domain-containing protein [Calditrichota bacterium]
MKPLRELILELSYNCDLACIMCGFGGKRVDKGRFMTETTLLRALDAVGVPPQAIRLNGRGESTLHPQFGLMLQLVRERFPMSQINLFSHMSWDRPSVMDALLWNAVQIFISLDSSDPQRLEAIRHRACFEKIVANLDRLRDYTPRPFVIFTLQEENFGDIAAMAEFAAERNLHLLVNTVRRDEGIEPFRDMVAARADVLRDAFHRAGEVFRGRTVTCHLPDRVQGIIISDQDTVTTYGGMEHCPAIAQELCVLFDGTATPCNMFNPYVYGSVMQQSLTQLYESEAFRWFENNHKQQQYCANCACLGGTA